MKVYKSIWHMRTAHLAEAIRTRSSELARSNYNADILRADLKTKPDRIKSTVAHSGQDFDSKWSIKNYGAIEKWTARK